MSSRRRPPSKGWRDAFLEFFSDDAVSVGPKATLAKDGLRKQPSTPFSELELVWEPRLGDVAASGDLGWLTGPSTSTNHTAKPATPRHGCYLSIWRKQPDGTWRVFIDVGTGAPEPVPFAPGMTRMAFANRYVGKDDKASAGKSLATADRELNTQMASQGPAKAFAARVAPASRLHRPGFVPVVGSDAIAAWLDAHASSGVAQRHRRRSRGSWGLRIHLRHIRDQSAEAADGCLPPLVEPRLRLAAGG